MNRDFEIKQLLRAYRSGILSDAAFEEELSHLEHETGEQEQPVSPGFEAGGRTYRSEREAVLSFLDELHATEMDSAIGFAKWSAVCRTMGLRSGLMVAAERNAYHARIIERRVHELGGDLRTTASQHGSKIAEVLGNGSIPDFEKLAALTAMIQEPQQAVAPLVEFASALNRDIETKQVLRLLAEDELSTATWLHEIFSVLTSRQAAAQAADSPRQFSAAPQAGGGQQPAMPGREPSDEQS
jgi:hypothetical protein